MAGDRIIIRGAREHNLKNLDLEIPRDQLVVITGLSGSGKSSLAFDTVYAEGQRRYVESLSAYARQFLEQMEKPEVDSIEGLSPAISIEQKTTSKNPRSTVGTVTEIYDYLRVFFARVGVPHCPRCGPRDLRPDRAADGGPSARAARGHSLPRPRPRHPGPQGRVPKALRRSPAAGIRRAYGSTASCASWPRRSTSTRTASTPSRWWWTGWSAAKGSPPASPTPWPPHFGWPTVWPRSSPWPGHGIEPMLFSERWPAPNAGSPCPRSRPGMFSFNNPYGACPECGGIGSREEIDPDRVVPNPTRSLKQGRAGAVGRARAPPPQADAAGPRAPPRVRSRHAVGAAQEDACGISSCSAIARAPSRASCAWWSDGIATHNRRRRAGRSSTSWPSVRARRVGAAACGRSRSPFVKIAGRSIADVASLTAQDGRRLLRRAHADRARGDHRAPGRSRK